MKTIQYMGSKKELLEFIEKSIEQFLVEIKEPESIKTFFDAFCGSGRVAYHFKDKYNVITNDKQYFTKVITDAYMCNTDPLSIYEPLIKELNDISEDVYVDVTDPRESYIKYLIETHKDGKDLLSLFDKENVFTEDVETIIRSLKTIYCKNASDIEKDLNSDLWWFTDNYACDYQYDYNKKGVMFGKSVGDDGNPKVWRTVNSRKIDMMRRKIEEWKIKEEINEIQQNVLLLSLILGINKISNVVGHQNGYLKQWSQGALKHITLTVPNIDDWTDNKHIHKNYTGDIFPALECHKADIVYYDPPYGTNNKNLVVATRYSSFYHLWNTLVSNERPALFGKAGKPTDTKGFTAPLEKNLKNVVMPKMVRLIEEAQGDYIAFSYSNKSLLTAKDFEEVYRIAGCDMKTYRLYVMEHKSNNQNILAKKEGQYINRANNDDRLIEYFFIAKKDPDHIRKTKPYRDLTNAEIMVEEKIDAVDEWLKDDLDKEDYNLPDENYVREYVKEYVNEYFLVEGDAILSLADYHSMNERRFILEKQKEESKLAAKEKREEAKRLKELN